MNERCRGKQAAKEDFGTRSKSYRKINFKRFCTSNRSTEYRKIDLIKVAIYFKVTYQFIFQFKFIFPQYKICLFL